MCLIKVNTHNFELDAIPCVDLKNPNSADLFRYNRSWILARFEDGMVITKLDTPEEAFIEYLPAEKAWKPVSAPGYIFINQLYVAEDHPDDWFKSELLLHCEVENSKKNGIVLMLPNESFKNSQHFYLSRGYLEHAHLPGFTLLIKKFKPEAPSPSFALSMEDKPNPIQAHLVTIKYADQSSFINYYIYEMKKVFEEMGFEVQLKKLLSASEARESGSPYGTFGVFLDGHFLTFQLLNRSEIEELIGTLDLNEMYPEVKHLYGRPVDFDLY
ncbi:YoaP domain-containing protein [Gracilimonas sp.]|uniref:YoaP domain-containing protein n=1 Tax=Gracilimonas sp. TaxID=1974203 RepID=UPI0032EE4221